MVIRTGTNSGTASRAGQAAAWLGAAAVYGAAQGLSAAAEQGRNTRVAWAAFATVLSAAVARRN